MRKAERLIKEGDAVFITFESQWGGEVRKELSGAQIELARAEFLGLIEEGRKVVNEISQLQVEIQKRDEKVQELNIKLAEFGGVFDDLLGDLK
jgi:hypothetical protein